VVRYVDLMESSIAQSIHKGFEKERWEIKGWGDWTFPIFSAQPVDWERPFGQESILRLLNLHTTTTQALYVVG
jgi:hypothetical protein